MLGLLIGTESVRNGAVLLSNAGLLHHSLVVGQSGSGKSFFVARLIEEILTRTGARVVALDPNGDLRNLDQIEMSGLAARREELANTASTTGLNPLDTLEQFEKAWLTQRMIFLSPEREAEAATQDRVERRRLLVDWSKIGETQAALLELNSHERPAQFLGVRACRGLVKWASSDGNLEISNSLRGLAEAAEMFADQNVNMKNYEYAKNLTRGDWNNVRARFLDLAGRHLIWLPDDKRRRYTTPTLTDILDAPFSLQPTVPDWNCLVIGLEAAQQSDALLAASVTLNQLWANTKQQARRATTEDRRVPTFLVIDEAHNFAPASTTDPLRKRVSEQILQIASEGRKFGLYLILATQRPTKLHPELVPECENSCVLRVQSARELKFASETLGILQGRVDQAARFTTGQGLISGRWVDSGLVEVLAGPARTAVGGGGLSGLWAEGPRKVELPERPAGSGRGQDVIAREKVQARLLESPTPVALASLASAVRAATGLGKEGRDWGGYPSFSAYLQSLGVPDLAVSSVPPSYAYLAGVHEPPSDDEAQNTDVVHQLHREANMPLLTPAQYEAVFEAIADELAVNPFSLNETGKAVRDALQVSSTPVGRAAVNYILVGIVRGSHDFSPDSRQDPEVLADAFLRGLTKSNSALASDKTTQARLRRALTGLDRESDTAPVTAGE